MIAVCYFPKKGIKRRFERMRAACAQLTDVEKRKVLHDTGKSVFVRGGLHSAH